MDQEHYMECIVCGERFDMRDLEAVVAHIHDDLPAPTFTTSRKVGDCIEYPKDHKPIHLN